jgi:hypothetical protein
MLKKKNPSNKRREYKKKTYKYKNLALLSIKVNGTFFL